MKKNTFTKLLPAAIFTACATLLVAPGFALQQSEKKEKEKTQEQEQSEADAPKDQEQEEDGEKKKVRKKKQIRTGTQRIGRMLSDSRGSDAMIEVVNPLTTSASEATVAVMSGGKQICLLYTSPSPRDRTRSRMPSSA